MTHDLLVRPATARDLPALLALCAQLHPGVPPPAPADAARILDEVSRWSGSALLVGCLGGVPVSTCALAVVPNLTRGAPSGGEAPILFRLFWLPLPEAPARLDPVLGRGLDRL